MDEKTGNERKTPLYDSHVALGGKMIPFAGYMLPVQYSGVIAEHMAVRTKAGLFDVSHMGEVYLAGRNALANLQNLILVVPLAETDLLPDRQGIVRHLSDCDPAHVRGIFQRSHLHLGRAFHLSRCRDFGKNGIQQR